MKKPIIILTGPTAAGKTKASIELAQKIGGEIISADSMQVYPVPSCTPEALHRHI